MAEKQNKNQPSPRPRLKPWIDPAAVSWLVLEPSKIAMVGGMTCATLCMVYLFLRQQWGLIMDPMDVLLRVCLTFVVSYTLTGAFVYYLLCIAERELPPETEPEPEAVPVSEDEAVMQEEVQESVVIEP